MRKTRIYTSQKLITGQQLSLEKAAAKHVVQVLRMRAGDELILFNGDGCDYPSRIETASKKEAEVIVISRSEIQTESVLEIHLYISISRGERMDYAIQKAVELGVSSITPLFSERSVVNLKGDRLEKRIQHWRQTVYSACEQSGRCYVPEVHHSMRLDELLSKPLAGTGIVLSHRTDATIRDVSPDKNRIAVLIGPEGGLSEKEVQSAIHSGYKAVRLGPRVMRTETAPVAAIAAMQTLWGDFR